MRYKILEQRAGYAIVDTMTENILPGSLVWSLEQARILVNQHNGVPNDVPPPQRRSAQRRAVASQPQRRVQRRAAAPQPAASITVVISRERASGRYR